MLTPTISIVTIAYNAEAHLAQTIQSVINQTYPDIEYIVIDGASTDSTLEIINTYRNRIHTVISEPDTGISNAMNKAIPYCHGSHILFLHADDYLLQPTSIADAVKEMRKTGFKSDIYAFAIHYGQPENYRFIPAHGLNIWSNVKLRSGINHQGALCSRQLFDTIGNFDETLKVCMDYDWFLRAYRNHVVLTPISMALSAMRNTGLSGQTDWQHTQTRIMEEKRIHRKNSKGILLPAFYFLWWTIYPTYKHYITLKKFG